MSENEQRDEMREDQGVDAPEGQESGVSEGQGDAGTQASEGQEEAAPSIDDLLSRWGIASQPAPPAEQDAEEMPEWAATSEPPAEEEPVEGDLPTWATPSEPPPEGQPVAEEPAAPGPPPEPPAVLPRKRRRRRLIWTIVGVVFAVLLVAAAVVAILAVPYVRGRRTLPAWTRLSNDHLVVAFPGAQGDDLYLLRLGRDKGEGTLLAEDVELAEARFTFLEDGRAIDAVEGTYGAFVPGLDWLLLWYSDGDEIVVDQMRIGDEAPTRVLDSKSDSLDGAVFPGRQAIFVSESREGRSRCYAGGPGGEAERVARADTCRISADGSTAILEETYGDELSVALVGTRGGKEEILIDDLVGVVSYQVSPKGDEVAFVLVQDGKEQLLTIGRAADEPAPVSDKALEVVDYGFAPGRVEVLYYVVREGTEGKGMALYVSPGSRPLAEGESIAASFTPDGDYLAYLLSDGTSSTLSVAPMGEGEAQTAWSGEGDVTFQVLHTAPPVLLITQVKDSEVTVHSADLDGANAIELLREDGVALEGVRYVEDEPTLYLHMTRTDGGSLLVVTPVGEAAPVKLLDGWTAFEVLNRSPKGDRLVVAAQKEADDEVVLYSITVEENAQPVVLDDEHAAFGGAVFTPNGRQVLYTCYLGTGPDTADICRVEAEGGKKHEVLHGKAFLVDARWDTLRPFVE